MNDADLVTVTISFPDADTAGEVAEGLVEARLAACAQALPVASTYRWKARIERADEHLLIVKTTAAALPALARLVLARHPYEVPEIVAQPVAWAHGPYGDWVRAAVDAAG